jgi:hypothetical protein
MLSELCQNKDTVTDELAINIIGIVWHVLSRMIIDRKRIASIMVKILHTIIRISKGVNQFSMDIIVEILRIIVVSIKEVEFIFSNKVNK